MTTATLTIGTRAPGSDWVVNNAVQLTLDWCKIIDVAQDAGFAAQADGSLLIDTIVSNGSRYAARIRPVYASPYDDPARFDDLMAQAEAERRAEQRNEEILAGFDCHYEDDSIERYLEGLEEGRDGGLPPGWEWKQNLEDDGDAENGPKLSVWWTAERVVEGGR